jgi:hypothetical protein
VYVRRIYLPIKTKGTPKPLKKKKERKGCVSLARKGKKTQDIRMNEKEVGFYSLYICSVARRVQPLLCGNRGLLFLLPFLFP